MLKIVVFGPGHRVGALVGDNVVDLNRADPKLPADLAGLIELGAAGIEAAERAIERAGGPANGALVRVADVKLHAPWPCKRIACAGGNYAEHSYGMAVNRGTQGITLEKMAAQIREAGQWGFWKVLDEVAGPGDEVPYPNRAEFFDYEGEAAIVIGKRGKDIPAGRIADYVWGVTLLNDWSIRDQGPAPRLMSFNLAKNFDRSASMGPCIVVGELDPQNIEVETRVNGTVRQRYNSKDMVYSFAEYVEFLSRDFTLVPGDVVSGGTGAGTAQDSTKLNADGSRPKDLFLKKGDSVSVSSSPIGTLENRIV